MPGQGDDDHGDTGSFEQLFERYHDAVYRHVLLMLRYDHAAAEDVTQEAWLRIAQGLKTFEGRSGFYTWACRIASNEVKRWWSQRKGRPLPRLVRNEAVEAEIEPDAAHAELVHEALRRVPEKYRQPLLLELWEGFSLREISSALGLPEGTVKSRLFRGRDKFRQAWLELGGSE
jgi:RNA polymerase sigma-70 factor (ECF subfamily)